jgi:hypothetical protein
VLDNHRWVYPYDAKGERRHFRDIPKTVAELKDDPFRSLAGELRRVGGFAKDTTPFSEFLWADFLRRRISRKSVEANFEKATEKALALASVTRNIAELVRTCIPTLLAAYDRRNQAGILSRSSFRQACVEPGALGHASIARERTRATRTIRHCQSRRRYRHRPSQVRRRWSAREPENDVRRGR